MIHYIIVDDETASHDIIRDYGSSLAFLSHKKSCYNAFEAMDYLNSNSVDLIFLDINMPKLSGFDFLKTLSNPPKIIVTTAYKEFALEGYELNVEDYLMKPFSFQRFITAVNKVNEAFLKQASPIKQSVPEEASIFIKDNKKHYQIKLNEILFTEAYGNYVKVYLKDQMLMTHQTLSAFEKLLPTPQFIRVHKSFVVASSKIELIEGNIIRMQDHKIPIGKLYKLNVKDLIK